MSSVEITMTRQYSLWVCPRCGSRWFAQEPLEPLPPHECDGKYGQWEYRGVVVPEELLERVRKWAEHGKALTKERGEPVDAYTLVSEYDDLLTILKGEEP